MENASSNQSEPALMENMQMYGTALAILIALLLIFGGFMASTRANADYICTQIVESSGSCTNGEWGGWANVSSNTDPETGSTATLQQRVYTGTRTIRHTITYLNRRTSCDSGYTQTYSGDTSGASGFHGGNIVTESQVCQIQEQRTVYTDANNNTTEVTGILSTEVNLSDVNSETTTLNSLSEVDEKLSAIRRANINLEISASPSIVSAGQTTEIRWSSVEMVACRITADQNADTWGAATIQVPDFASIAGTETSSPIDDVTLYTIECTDFEGGAHEETATVRIVPTWEEF